MNWLILLALVTVFVVQVAEAIEYAIQQDAQTRDTRPSTPRATTPSRPSAEPPPPQRHEIPGITGKLMLRGWSLQGLFGYMWLHGGVLHLLGNMLFLWVFGNAVCAKIGNLRYLGLYILLGVAAGAAHLLISPGAVLGASGAINGVVGMYLVLYYQNDITCLFMIWLILPLYVRVFAISSIWLILFRLLWDIVGAFASDGAHVAYFAHLGGFGAGFAIAFLMCKKGWITMERYERSLLQMWEERTHGRQQEPLEATYARLGLHLTEEEHQQEASVQTSEPEPIPLPPIEPGPAPAPSGTKAFIRTACGCGHAIRVTRQYAGRTVRCPNCRQRIVIPHETDFFGPAPQPALGTALLNKASDDLIRFVCPCGRRIKVPAPYAGRTCRCPQCGTRLRIPAVPS